MRTKLSKKLVLTITLVAVLIILAVLVYLFWPIIKPIKESPTGGQMTREEQIKKQLEELQKLPTTLTKEDIEKQLKELGKQPQPLSEEEINKQLKELK